MSRSKIEWTDATWNPVRGCSRVSAGCEHCYAETMAARFSGPGQPFEGFAEHGRAGSAWTGRVELIAHKLAEPLRWREPRRIFVNSMSDLFHEALNDEAIAAVFGVMAACPQHVFQILTKRPERMRGWLEWVETFRSGVGCKFIACAMVANQLSGIDEENDRQLLARSAWTAAAADDSWPLPNVWLGVSVEDQATADERIPILLDCPAATRFVSYEPALGPIDFQSIPDYLHAVGWRFDALRSWRWRVSRPIGARRPEWIADRGAHPSIDWLIVGGESGPGARPCDIAWIRSAIEQCREAGVPVFVKQLGAHAVLSEITLSEWPEHVEIAGDGVGIGRGRLFFRDPKGGDPDEWPEGLRVREFPA